MAKNWRNSRAYRKWRISIIRRDRVCLCCKSIKNRHAHHIKHATYFPELRFDVNNGICLCAKCHSVFHNDMIGNTRKKCDDRQLIDFFRLKAYFAGIG